VFFFFLPVVTLGVGLRMMSYHLQLLVIHGVGRMFVVLFKRSPANCSSQLMINDDQHPRIGISSMLSVDSLSQLVPGLKART